MKVVRTKGFYQRLSFLRLLAPFMTNKKHFTGLFVLRFLTLMSGLIAPIFYKIMVDDVLIGQRLELLWVVALGYAAVYATEAVILALETYCRNKTCFPLIIRLEEKLLKTITNLSPRDLARLDSGELKTRVMDGDLVVPFIEHHILEYLQAIITSGITAVILLFIDYKLALISFLSIPLSFLMTKFLGKKKLASAQALRTERTRFDGYIHSTLQNWKQVKILGLENEQSAVFTRYRGDISRLFMKNQVFWYLNRTFISIKDFFVTKMNLYFIGGLFIFSGGISVGGLLVFMVYFDKLFGALESINDLDMRLNGDLPGMDRIRETLEMNEAMQGKAGKEISEFQSLSLKDVGFLYGKGLPYAVQNVSLELKRGDRAVLSGRSGCGKSTVIKLMLGLYEDFDGTILLNGININEIKKRCLHGLFGVVMQEPYLFNLSIRENLMMATGGRRDLVTDETLWESLRLAAIYDFVASLPEGLDSVIGEKGIRLSGGQRQRLAIARALLKKPEVFIFDEATSALDHESERAIHDVILNISTAQTVVLISHRPVVNDKLKKINI